MKTYPLNESDRDLIEAASAKIRDLYEENRHHVGAALKTSSGKTVAAVHIEAYIGRVTVCAEAIAIGKAISDGEKGFDTIVAVKHPYSDDEERAFKVVSPCGMCRELISDYAKECFVILNINGETVKTKIGELLPYKYTRDS
ncbi:cytidine deaminase [Peribacillus frigoritolerans]|uniref:cytidine deaminase n=1 Tax=Peribacillus frigoritolerans TaxID=450367 RepID=UPI00164EB826|nr:cytidine deaminase [Peribacillus frigoritolerans]QNK51165.1 cytidine deaminase [Brevibacterium sp. PAMC23299]UYZ01756.1 cytidine deaminase [Peribacillus frigoritolerans]